MKKVIKFLVSLLIVTLVAMLFANLTNMTEEETIKQMHFEQIDQECHVDLSEEMTFPAIALSYKTHTYKTRKGFQTFDTPLLTYGNIGIVQAQPKAGKSFLMSLLSSVFLSKTGQNKYGGDLKGHSRGGCVIHIDTEQGKFHAQRMFRRAINMNEESDLGCYHTYALRQENFKTKREFISWKLKDLVDNGQTIDLILIDGVADLCVDVNDNVDTRLLVEELMRWSAVYNCAVLGVIHTNYNSTKATGHLGSHVQKKVETLININRDEDIVSVECQMSRNKSFDTFSFSVDEYGMPKINEDLDVVLGLDNNTKKESKWKQQKAF